MHASPSSNHLRIQASLRHAPQVGLGPSSRDPLARVLDLGLERHVLGVVLAIFIALFLHGTAVARLAMIRTELLAWQQRASPRDQREARVHLRHRRREAAALRRRLPKREGRAKEEKAPAAPCAEGDGSRLRPPRRGSAGGRGHHAGAGRYACRLHELVRRRERRHVRRRGHASDRDEHEGGLRPQRAGRRRPRRNRDEARAPGAAGARPIAHSRAWRQTTGTATSLRKRTRSRSTR